MPSFILTFAWLASWLNSGYLFLFSYLLLFIITTLILIGIFYRIRDNEFSQQHTLENILIALVNEDYSLRGHAFDNKDFGTIINLANQLADKLLDKQRDIIESSHFKLQLLDMFEAAILITDPSNKIKFANNSAEQILKLPENNTIIVDWLLDLDLPLGNHSIETRLLEKSATLLIQKEKFFQQGQPIYLYFIKDVSNLLYEKEVQSWRRLIRVLNHEINNSMAPIASLSKQLAKRVSALEDKKMSEGLDIIYNRVNHLHDFISHYSKMAKLPKPRKLSIELKPFLQKSCAIFDSLSISIDCTEKLFVCIDPAQIQQALINLIKNSQEAFVVTTEKSACHIDINVTVKNNLLMIHILDNGSGISNIDNLFVPFYTTKKHGAGIGLVLSKHILFNHQGELLISNRLDKNGTLVKMTLPFEMTKAMK
tara:strand:- start:10760 stop:12034 length:1275 start_codon:yes stop_codon:yes gene_type:complete